MTLANLISLARLALVPVILAALMSSAYGLALVLMLLAALSDAVDGHIARTWGQETALGRHLDPLADKILLTALFVVLAVKGEVSQWLAALVVGRDLVLVAGTVVATALGRPIAVRPLAISKLATVMQMSLVLSVLAGLFLERDMSDVVTVLVWTVAGLTGLSGALYTARWVGHMTTAKTMPPAGSEHF
ncbi:MAG: CDP-alcohol phosphatidyltransferase family protein [Pseudomonadota bacterium]